MRFICYREFDDPEEPIHPGIVIGQKVLPLARVLTVAEAINPQNLTIPDDLFELIGLLPTFSKIVKDLTRTKVLDQLWQEVGVTLTAPLPRPNRIFGIGRNYAEHAKETGAEVPTEEPIVFLKASSCVIGSGKAIVYPDYAEQVDFEGELAVVIGMAGKDIARDDAMRHVAGYTIFNDVTERFMQKRDIAKGLPWFRSKSLDTFGPMGPALITPDEIKDPHNLTIRTAVNGEVKQEANTKEMVHRIDKIISYLSHYFALEPGDVIATGTPSGIGPLAVGDVVTVTIEGIGTLSNPVVAAI
ncbi:MAG TPA: fumarylacetoacetate hydrolase family protein [Capsulimonadaceae bacterium]|jgi:2-keto-4-pentenoate hydratase/2-oxohepta-3-ene-1,7-dioic acid hydratase in catechol pathway